MKLYLLGLATLPALWLAFEFTGIAFRTIRDTRRFCSVGLRPGYGRWRWLYLVPMAAWDMLKMHVWGWWNGVRSELQ